MTIGPAESVAAAARRMHDRRVKRLPVVDDAGRLVGIVSRVDVLSVYTRPDEEIRYEITRIIEHYLVLDPAALDVRVRAGIVTVTGQAETRAVALQLADALRHIEGVVDVRDQITYPPGSGLAAPVLPVFPRPPRPV